MKCPYCNHELEAGSVYCISCGNCVSADIGCVNSPFSEPDSVDQIVYQKPGLLTAIKRYADFGGRATRAEYWLFVLLQLLAGMAINMITAAAPVVGAVISLLWNLFIFIPSWAVLFRRLHDINRSAWWILFGLIPIVGWITMLVFLLTDSAPGPNKWGLNPKGIGNENYVPGSIQPRRYGCVIAFLIVGFVVMILTFFALLAAAEEFMFGGDSEFEKAHNLRMIGLACQIYATDNEDYLPDSLSGLEKEDYLENDWLMPDVVYLGKGLNLEQIADPAKFPIAYLCMAEDNQKEKVIVLYADGAVDDFDMPDDFVRGDQVSLGEYLLSQYGVGHSREKEAALRNLRGLPHKTDLSGNVNKL